MQRLDKIIYGFVAVVVFSGCFFNRPKTTAGDKVSVPLNMEDQQPDSNALIKSGSGDLSGQLIEVDITEKYPEKDFYIQDVADVEYIPLETRSDALISIILDIYVSDQYIVTYQRNGDVFVFHRDGRIRNYFNHEGRGPGEYKSISKMTVDELRQEIYIYDYALNYRILVYSFDGTFKRLLRLPPEKWIGFWVNYNPENLLFYDDYSVRRGDSPLVNAKKTYFLLDKVTGEIKPLNLIPERQESDMFMWTLETKRNYSRGKVRKMKVNDGRASSIIKNGNEVFISEYTMDTVYRLEGTTLTPFLVKQPSVRNLSSPLLFWISLKTNRYILMNSIRKDNAEKRFYDENYFIYDQYTRGIFTPCFKNRDIEPETHVRISSVGCELPENYALFFYTAPRLIEKYNTGKLSGKLKKVASQLNEEDNPVLMLVRFRK